MNTQLINFKNVQKVLVQQTKKKMSKYVLNLSITQYNSIHYKQYSWFQCLKDILYLILKIIYQWFSN